MNNLSKSVMWGVAAVLVVLFVGVLAVRAEQIRLKNGNVLEGTIKSRTKQQVVVTIPELGDLTLAADEILAIEGGSDPEPAADDDAASESDAAAGAEEASGDFRVFRSGKRGVRLSYPKTWHVKERPDQHPYVVTSRPEPIMDPPTGPAPVAIELFKYYHASGTIGFDHAATAEELLARAKEMFLKAGGTILQETPREVQLAPGLVMEGEGNPPGGSALRMLMLFTARHDVLVSLFCQAPAEQFEANRPVFEEVIAQAAPFSTGDADNAQLDRHTNQLEREGVQALEKGNGDLALKRLSEAVAVNPGAPTHHLSFGSALMLVGRQAPEEHRAGLLGRAEQELTLAAGLFPIVDGKKESAPMRAQALFLLGEIAEFVRVDHARAQHFYQLALKAYPHPGAQEAMKRYQKAPP